ncbi:hypothetical protein [Deinococcus aerophilus]|uniref:Uncharacterized protein n=1 Tax=Deinococcus aerophilus TaxID=522488 RepID=A0ABQ2GQ64_9DEIO|nr:hypothetical protein [Deinococcus aerophilus]GGM07698.1 hypothetical protein GCM10010841_15000 [Deinococcus aerophilus]
MHPTRHPTRTVLLAPHSNAGVRVALSAYDALWLAIRGGAAVLNRDDICPLAPGFAANLIVGYSGATHDSAAPCCVPRRARPSTWWGAG